MWPLHLYDNLLNTLSNKVGNFMFNNFVFPFRTPLARHGTEGAEEEVGEVSDLRS